MEATSFAQRRPAATNLPPFSLPPSDIPSTRYPSHAPTMTNPGHSHGSSSAGPRVVPVVMPAAPGSSGPSPTLPTPSSSSQSTAVPTTTSTANARGSTVLTPSSGNAIDGLTPSPGVNTSSSQSSPPGAMNYAGHMAGSWPLPGNSQQQAYTYANANSGTPGSTNELVQPPYSAAPYPPRSHYETVSPPMQHHFAQQRSPNSPARNGEQHAPAQPSYQEQSPFPAPVAAGGGSTTASQGASLLDSQASSTTTQPPTQAAASAFKRRPSAIPIYGNGHYMGPARPPPPPQPAHYYPASSASQQNSYYPAHAPQSGYQAPSPQRSAPPTPTTPAAPTGGGGGGGGGGGRSGIATIAGGGMGPPLGFPAGRGPPTPHAQPQHPSHHHPGMGYSGYSQHMPTGTVLSNMHNPGGAPTVVGHMPSHHPLPYALPHGLSPHHQSSPLYMQHGPNAAAQQERPFKCDQCPQSFNRNHDLKRHKRIHLAVKPFPCDWCDKSFSRKDALKRHKLVKGCGEGKTSSNEMSREGGAPNGECDMMDAHGDATSSGDDRDGGSSGSIIIKQE